MAVTKLNEKQYGALTRLAVPCGHCGAKIGESCVGVSKKPWATATHLVRKHAMKDFRQNKPERYNELRRQVSKSFTASGKTIALQKLPDEVTEAGKNFLLNDNQ